MGNRRPISPERRRDKWTGLAIIVLSFLGCMGLSMWGLRASTPKPAPDPLPLSKEEIPGFPNEVDPFAVIARARALSHRERFQGFEVTGVSANGVVDLSKPGTSIQFSFQSESGRGAQPIREPGTLPNRRFCGLQHIWLDKNGIVARPDNPGRSCGSGDVEELKVPTACTIKGVWKIAKKQGFDRKKAAQIDYYDSVGGPAFRIVQGKRRLSVSARDCSSVLKGRESQGSVP